MMKGVWLAAAVLALSSWYCHATIIDPSCSEKTAAAAYLDQKIDSWQVGHVRQPVVHQLVSFGRQYFTIAQRTMGATPSLTPIILLNQLSSGKLSPARSAVASALFRWVPGQYWMITLDDHNELWIYHSKLKETVNSRVWVGAQVPLPEGKRWVGLQIFRHRNVPNRLHTFLRSSENELWEGELLRSQDGMPRLANAFSRFAQLPSPLFEVLSPEEVVTSDLNGEIFWLTREKSEWQGSLHFTPSAIYSARNFGHQFPGKKLTRQERLTLWALGKGSKSRRWYLKRWSGYERMTFEETLPHLYSERLSHYDVSGFSPLADGRLAAWFESADGSKRLSANGALWVPLFEDLMHPLGRLLGDVPPRLLQQVHQSQEDSLLANWALASSAAIYSQLTGNSTTSPSRALDWLNHLAHRAKLFDFIKTDFGHQLESEFRAYGLPETALVLALQAVLYPDEISERLISERAEASPKNLRRRVLRFRHLLASPVAHAVAWLKGTEKPPFSEAERTIILSDLSTLLAAFHVNHSGRAGNIPDSEAWAVTLSYYWRRHGGHYPDHNLYEILRLIACIRDPLRPVSEPSHLLEILN